MSLYLGFDLSTQQLKIIACNDNLSIHSKYAINFDEYSGKYGTHKGVLADVDTGEVVTPVALFLEALQTLLDRMKEEHFPFDKVRGISGSCQQHGTVYYSSQISNSLASLSAESNSWCNDMADSFSFPTASNWQDRSTEQEIDDFEKALGSAKALCEMTGSKAHYRFSGLQIRRRARGNSKEWKNTSHVGLVSSFLDTFLTGQLRGVELGEACGTNLFDIQHEDWNDELLSLILMKNSRVDGVSKEEEAQAAKRAREMLGPVVHPDDSKHIAKYLVKRYGFSEQCVIWPITGDNLATIMSLPLNKDDLLVSMGTSTTVLLLTEKYIPSVNYHLFRHPVCPGIYMGMLCYCNGALAREQIRDEVNKKYSSQGWDKFDEILDARFSKDEKDNVDGDEKVGIYFPLGEIIPNAKACKRRFAYSDKKGLVELSEEDVNVEQEAVMIIESQALSCRLRVCPMLGGGDAGEKKHKADAVIEKALAALERIVGDKVTVDHVSYGTEEFMKRPKSVYYVGGSSKNESIVRVFNDVLGPLLGGFRVEIGDACALGGCFRAIWGCSQEGKLGAGSGVGFEEWIKDKFDFSRNVDRVTGSAEDGHGETDADVDADAVERTWARFSNKVGILSLAEKRLDE